MATLSVRIIRNFEHGTFKYAYFNAVDLSTVTVGQLKSMLADKIQKERAFLPYRKTELNSLKINFKAHSYKSCNLIMTLDRDDEWLLLDDNKTLEEGGVEHETELAYFDMEPYREYQGQYAQKPSIADREVVYVNLA
eukprot:TRINITY_DN33257_c0_g1_i1.p1 TRINITY_DN33257_c0_g1~~TRINITY_DN33257_c0_g1_i1.p1  ORF type:complete len:137 (+),score=27.91 TRINITY_DN33257_c0_g1_i1:164-574(+)